MPVWISPKIIRSISVLCSGGDRAGIPIPKMPARKRALLRQDALLD